MPALLEELGAEEMREHGGITKPGLLRRDDSGRNARAKRASFSGLSPSDRERGIDPLTRAFLGAIEDMRRSESRKCP